MLDLPRLYQAFRPQRGWIAAFTGACIAATIFAYAVMPPHYLSSAALLVNPNGLQVVERDLRSSERFNSDSYIVETQMRVMTTDSVLRRVVEKMQLASDPEFVDGGGVMSALRSGIKRLLGASSADRDPPELTALRALREKVWTTRSGDSYLVEIHARTKSAAKSAAIANAVADAYLEGEFQASAQAAQRAASSLSDGLDELRIQVRDSENAVAQYKAANDIAGSEGRLVTEQQLSELNVRLIQAAAITANAKAKLDQWERLAASGSGVEEVAEALGSQTISQLRAQYSLLEQRHAEALLVYGDRHPSIRTIALQQSSVRDLIAQELRRIGGSVRNTYESALQNENALRAELEELKKKTFDSGFAQVRLRELERQLETSRTVYQAFLQRAQEVSEQQALDVSNVRVVTKAIEPENPTRPPLTFLLFLAAVVGLGLSMGFLILREQMRAIGSAWSRDTARQG